MTTNPLLDFSDLPQFAAIQPSHVAEAVDTLIAQAKTALDTVTKADFPADWKKLSSTLDVQTEKLSRAWGAVGHLNAVADTPELRAAYNEKLAAVSEFYTALGSDERLFAKYKAIDSAALNAEQKKAHSNALRSFKLGGAELQGAAKERFAAIQTRLSELSQKFSENTLDSTEAFAYFAAEEELDGLPDDVKSTAKQLAEKDGKGGYKLTLKMPCYLPVMQYAKSSALREKLYMAHNTRASELFEGGKFDNTPIMREILALRQEESKLLGYTNFAQVSLVPKMANSPEEVVSFLRDLGKRAKPFAQKDVQEMREFAAKELGLSDPQAWDWPFIGEKLKEAKYSFSEQEVKQYFTAPKVLAGLFNIIQTLFEVDIQRDQAPVWNPKVEFYALMRGGQKIAQFYLDTPARDGKRGGAWMNDVHSRWLRPDTNQLQIPVAHLICNFADGVDGKPALLTHDDVITLFHEFGHGLHHMLTQVSERDVSGISGVEWDAVELPSQFMENFCWEWDVLKHMTAHVDTGAPLPRELFDKMLAAKNFQSGLQTIRQIEFALFDMLMHMEPDSTKAEPLEISRAVHKEVGVLPRPAQVRTPNSFGHVFSGGYAAGYYSYKWAELLSADAYAAFEEAATQSGQAAAAQIEVGRKYRKEVLEVGGSRSAAESFAAFRGRAPQLDALLRHSGMA
ncbi:M3 family metallopeptidase [Variovorax sp. PCZ-1]|uniref:M3 family metallopeptidase n=1 Tax=Variovorax sp. PCZ-1 TaxID=2835533 RepID=UPI001BCC734B|nr:M3 family metallopeptidase [Variovorax sp. PCZ-1]MBS7806344.1 M3 family metallopeptidase [Variovorax sp. PCZ-1]